MEGGMDQKLKEHIDMINSNIDIKIKPLQEHVNKIDNDFNAYKLDCLDHRRRQGDEVKMIILSQQRSETTQNNTNKNVESIKDTLEKYLPSLKDTEEKLATKHQLKEGALLISAIFGAIITIGTVLLFVFAYFNGLFVK